MIAYISQALIRTLTPKAQRYDVRDTSVKGFMLRVEPTGRMVYYLAPKRGAKPIRIEDATLITPTKARARAIEWLPLVAKGIDPRAAEREARAQSQSFNAFLADTYGPWVESHRKDGTATLARLRACFSVEFGKLRLAEIDTAKADRWRAARLQEGAAPATVNRDFVALKAALSKALEWGFVNSHPLATFKPLRTDSKGKPRYLTPDEERRLRAALDAREARIRAEKASANAWRQERGYELRPEPEPNTFADHLQPMVLVSINTGLRQGELFGLTWADLDLNPKRPTLTVRGDNAKSGSSRHVPLNDEARIALSAWREQSGDIGEGLVFHNREGGRFDNVNTSWRHIMRAADIEDFRWHDLRHTFASKLVMAGVDLNTVRELLGHGDIKMTLRYAHLAPEHKALAVAKLNAPAIEQARP